MEMMDWEIKMILGTIPTELAPDDCADVDRAVLENSCGRSLPEVSGDVWERGRTQLAKNFLQFNRWERPGPQPGLDASRLAERVRQVILRAAQSWSEGPRACEHGVQGS